MWMDFCGGGRGRGYCYCPFSGVGTRVGWVTQQQYPLRLDQGSRTPPTDWAWPRLGLAERCISHSKGTFPDIGNLVMGSLAALPKRFLALQPTMPGEFDIVRDS
ncbi:hypothetical protein V6N13_051356 [Hibiscus sabdariffa]